MLKLHQLFLRFFLTIIALTIAVAMVVSYFTLKTNKIATNVKHLKSEISIVSVLLQQRSRFDEVAKRIKAATGYRVTIVNEQGLVVAESDEDKYVMQNHLDRPEIEEAVFSEFGQSIRFSDTLEEDFLYIAKRVEIEGKPYYLRMAIILESIQEDLVSLWFKLSIMFIVTIALSYVVAYFIQKRIKLEIDGITTFLNNIVEKRYKGAYEGRFSFEFMMISKLLKKMGRKLEKRDKQRRKDVAKLRLKNKQRNDIISAISHEFKNPIAVILGYCETILNAEVSPAIRQKFLMKIEKNANKMSAMIDRLSLMSRLEDDDLQPQLSRFDLYGVCSDVKNMLEEKHKNRVVHFEGSSVEIEADKTLIELVLINLVDNALKYSSKDVYLTLTQSRIEVRDFGVGIGAEDLEKITKKFYRVDKHYWDNSLGLGLSIVKNILLHHGFELEIESTPQEGSRFYFDIIAKNE